MVDKVRGDNNFYYADNMRVILEFCIYKMLSHILRDGFWNNIFAITITAILIDTFKETGDLTLQVDIIPN